MSMRRLLVANRGEIALRIVRAARADFSDVSFAVTKKDAKA